MTTKPDAVPSGKSPLRVVPCAPECFTVYNGERLDPVLVILQDFGHGRGRITLECYGQAWSAYWGAMGDDCDLRAFLAGANDDYIANRMIHDASCSNKARQREMDYLLRIVATVKRGLTMQPEPVPAHD